MNQAIVAFDRSGIAISWNPAAELTFDLSGHRAESVSIDTFAGSADVRRAFDAALKGEAGRIFLDDGRVPIWCRPTRADDGAVIGAHWVVMYPGETEAEANPRVAEVLREAVDTMDEALSIYDSDDRFVFGNRRFFEMYPFLRERDDIVGHDFEDLLRYSLARDPSMTEGERDDYVQRRLEARRDQSPIPERQVPDGSWYMVKENYSKTGLTITTRVDITRRKQAELSLAATSTVLQAILDTMPNPLIAFDRDNHLVAWNRAFESLVKLSADDLKPGRSLVGVAKDAIRRLPSTDVGIKRMFRAIRGRESVQFEWRREGSDVFWVIGRPMWNGGYLSMWRDVTSERRAQELVATTQNRLVEAIETMSEGFALFDSEDRLILSNAKYKELYDLPQEAIDEAWTFERLVRYSIAHGHFPEAVGREEEWISRRIHQHLNPPETSVEQLLSDGRTYLVSENRTREGGVVGMRSDITERIQAEEALRSARDTLAEQTQSLRKLADEIDEARRRAEEGGAAKSRFLAMMSHELRTPMTGLLGMIELLSRTDLDADQSGFIDIMRDSADTLLALLNDILDYSKLEAGKVQLEEIPFSPRSVLDDVMRLFQISAASKGLELLGGADDAVPGWLLGDPLRLKQILSNLVSNGLKFTNEGSVSVSLSVGESQDERVEIVGSVTDSGIGIPDDVQGQLFAAFEQGPANTSRRFGGTGLGLSICKRLVEGMEGWIKVDSAPGAGATFTFCVVMHPTAAPEIEPADAVPGEPARPIHILLAEDNDVNRMLVSRMLAKAGHRIDEVPDGAEAVKAVRRRTYDLVLMDMQMPVMDGTDATAEIRAMGGEKAEMPIIALTADAVPEHRATYLDAGLDDVLLKPVDWEALNRTILWASGKSRATAPREGAVGAERAPPVALVFDRARVRAAVGTLPPARAVEMIALVPQEAARQIALLEAAVDQGDLEAVGRIAHTIKGLAANFGAVLLEKTAVRLQRAEGGIAAVTAHLPDLRAAVDATREEAPAVIAEFEAAAKD
ncbi:MAG: PAS-domain containing protein [Thalassobaculaceae bacterium]|nr:PAS-domain containing protein [Thalassobaculaceae bacterium]